jgi:hypothetical protein
MSDLKRILEVMNYQVGKPVTEQKKYFILEDEDLSPAGTSIDDLIEIGVKILDVTTSSPKLASISSEIVDVFTSKFNKIKTKYNLPPNPTFVEIRNALNRLKNEVNTNGILDSSNPNGVRSDIITDTEKDLNVVLGRWAQEVASSFATSAERMEILSLVNNDAKKIYDKCQDIIKDASTIKVADYTKKQTIIDELNKLKSYYDSQVSTIQFLSKFNDDISDTISRATRAIDYEQSDISKTTSDITGYLISDEMSVYLPEILRRYYYKFQETFGKTTVEGYPEKLVSAVKQMQSDILGQSRRQGSFDERKVQKFIEYIFYLQGTMKTDADKLLERLVGDGVITKEMSDLLKKDGYVKFWDEFIKRPTMGKTKDMTGQKDITFFTALFEEFYGLFKMSYGMSLIGPIFRGIATNGTAAQKFGVIWKDIKEGYARLFWSQFYLSTRLPSEIARQRSSLNAGMASLGAAWLFDKVIAHAVAPWCIATLKVAFNGIISFGVMAGAESLRKLYFGPDQWGARDFENFSYIDALKIFARESGAGITDEDLADLISFIPENGEETEGALEWFTEATQIFTNMFKILGAYVEYGLEGRDSDSDSRLLDEYERQFGRLLERIPNDDENNGGDENTTTETTQRVGTTIIGTEQGFKDWIESKREEGYVFVGFANGVGSCTNGSGINEDYYWSNNQWTIY